MIWIKSETAINSFVTLRPSFAFSSLQSVFVYKTNTSSHPALCEVHHINQ